MKKNIFGIRRFGGGIVIDTFFTELMIIIPVFAISCCGVLQMFSIASRTAENKRIKASAVACAQSWCELYSAGRDTRECASEIFDGLPDNFLGHGSVIVDKSFAYNPDGNINIIISESGEDTERGRINTSVISIIWSDGELSQTAARYEPDFGEETQ